MATPTARARTKTAATDPKSKLPESWVGRVPPLKPGSYADGLPIHDVQYLCCKLILRPHRFDSRESLFSFADVMKGPAKETGVKLSTQGFHKRDLRIREVLFVDTHDFRLYNNAFILRRRIPYRDGFPVGEPEVVFQFCHPDMQAAAETRSAPAPAPRRALAPPPRGRNAR